MSLLKWSERAHGFIVRWQLVGATWFAVTRADDLMRKADRVPSMEEAILQMKINQEISDRRLDTLERAQAASEKRAERQNAEISDKLDRLLEKRNER